MNGPGGPEALLQQLDDEHHNSPHDPDVRRAVELRARQRCEYCLIPSAGRFHVDHIIPALRWHVYVHGLLPGWEASHDRRGPDHMQNFAWACPDCNFHKSTRVAVRLNGAWVRLFDPRSDAWPDYFVFAHRYLFIVGVTPVGLATERALRFNLGGLEGPLGTRHDAILHGRYPPTWARPLLWADT